jgi:hypothetical protein
MATFQSTQAARINNAEAGTYRPNPANQNDGPLRCAFFSYTVAGTEAANDIIELCNVPAGARILNVFIASDDLGGEFTVKIGDADDADRFVDALALGDSVGQFIDIPELRVDTDNTKDDPAYGFGYKYDDQTMIIATISDIGSPSANKQLRGYIAYTVN